MRCSVNVLVFEHSPGTTKICLEINARDRPSVGSTRAPVASAPRVTRAVLAFPLVDSAVCVAYAFVSGAAIV